MKIKCLLLVIALPVGAVMAQQAPAAGPHKITVYLTADGTQLPSAEGADHRADISLRDSVSGTVKEYFPSGKLRRMASYAHVPRGVRHGVEMTYNEAGQLRRRQEFVAGQQQGELQLFNAEGKITRKVVFDNDQRVSQQCFNATGEPQICTDEKVLPEFPGGTNSLIRAIEQEVVMPHEDLMRQRFGTVLLKFVVDKNSHIVGVNVDPKSQEGSTVILPPSPAMCQAVAAAVSKIRFLASGEVNGEPTTVLYSLPIKVGHPASGYAIIHSTDVIEHQPKISFLEE